LGGRGIIFYSLTISANKEKVLPTRKKCRGQTPHFEGRRPQSCRPAARTKGALERSAPAKGQLKAAKPERMNPITSLGC